MQFDDDDGVPPGYYSTVSRPDAGSSMPTPPGPGTHVARIAFGGLFVLLSVVFAALVLAFVSQNPLSFAESPRYFVARILAMIIVPACFLLMGIVLLRASDTPARISRLPRHQP